MMTTPHLHPLPEFQLLCRVALGTEAQSNIKMAKHKNAWKQTGGAAQEASLEEALSTRREGRKGCDKISLNQVPLSPHFWHICCPTMQGAGAETWYLYLKGAKQTERAQRWPSQQSHSGLAGSWSLCLCASEWLQPSGPDNGVSRSAVSSSLLRPRCPTLTAPLESPVKLQKLPMLWVSGVGLDIWVF